MSEKSRNAIKYILLGISMLVFLVVLLAISPWVVWRLIGIPDFIRNNNQLETFASNIYDYPLPPNTMISETSSQVSLLGNGNHCDFVVEVTLETNLSMPEIIDYYSSVEFPPVRTEYQGILDTHSSGFHGVVKPRLDLLEKDDGANNLIVLLKVIDFGYPPGMDFRCH